VRTPRLAVWLFGGLVVACLLFVGARTNDYVLYVANLTIINSIISIGLVVLAGVGGQLSLGTAALVAVGSYACGILIVHLGLPFVLAGILSMAVTTIVGTTLVGPAMRLSGLHLAIVTLAFGIIIVQMIGQGGNLTGGMTGLTIPPVFFLGISLASEWHRYILNLVILLCVIFSTSRLIALKPGRALLAIRERELAARALGIDPARYKLLAFAYSSFLCGLGGVLYAAEKGYLSVEDFTVWQSIYFFVMIVLGGMYSVAGGIVGAVIVTVVPEFLGGFQESAQLVFGIVVLAIILFAPDGVVGVLKRTVSNFKIGR
jgi:branched-chain amino acid transport system permease protein